VIETPVEKRTEDDRGSGAGHWAETIPLMRARAGAWLTARSRAVRVLPSDTQAFRILVFGSSISMLGTRISTLAFPMLVLGIKGSPLIAGIVAFAAIAPGVFLYMPVGAIVDRRNPRRVMLVSEISRGVVAILVVVGLLIYGRNISIIFLLLAMLAEEVLEIFYTLADRRYLNRLMERDKIRSRQASAEARTHAAVLVGRPIGPLLFTLGSFLPFLADAISFVASVVSLLLIRSTDEPQETGWPTFKEVTSGIGHGVGTVKGDRRIWLTSLLMAMTSVVSQALILIFLVEAHSGKLSTLAIGIVLGASGVGGAVGSYCSKIVLRFIRRRWLPIQMGTWFIVFFVLTMTRGGSASWSAAAMFVMSVSGAIGNVEYGTYLKENIADDMIGKISGVSYTMTIGACALGPVFGGYAVQESSIKGAVSILFLIVALMAFTSLLVFKKSPHRPSSQSLPAQCAPVDGTESPRPAPVPLVSADRSHAGIRAGIRGVAIACRGNSRWARISRPSSTIHKQRSTCGNVHAQK
jgi:predicted MFS family arabinose efflux permease